MQKEFYEYSLSGKDIYSFTSRGKRNIQKEVGFSSTRQKGVYNLWLADIIDDTIDDMAVSDNGDMVKVIATIVQIIISFTNAHPKAIVLFKGNTQKRMDLYERILQRHYHEFRHSFLITAVTETGKGEIGEVPFEDRQTCKYVLFSIQKEKNKRYASKTKKS